MPACLTSDLVTALAPDAASLKAGLGLASPGKWTLAAGDETAVWGLMQGSGKDPYQVQALADGTATKCTCPSRKFPCKHAIALLFIAAEQPAGLAASPPPPWVMEWLAARQEKAAKSEAKAVAHAEGASRPPVDEKAQAKRREKRADRLAEGVAFLQQWLNDLTRQGLADAPVTDRQFWESTARRLVDAQAPGLARFLRLAASPALQAQHHPAPLSHHLGRLHLLLAASRQLPVLDPPLRAEVEQLLGWTIPQDTVLTGPEVPDTWFVAARTFEEEDRVITAITWLWGAASRRWAQWIQSAPAQQPVFTPIPTGRWVCGSMAFYPGLAPLRALWKTNFSSAEAPAAPLSIESVPDLLQRYADSLAIHPWRTHLPFCLRAVFHSEEGQDWLVDECGHALPASASTSLSQLIPAVDGGRPVAVFGLWTGTEAIPLAMDDHGHWLSLTGGTAA